MLTGWLWRVIKPKPLSALVIVAVWGVLLAILWFLVYPVLGPLAPLTSTGGAGMW